MRCAFRYCFLFFFLLFVHYLHAQKEGNIWYFGNYVGLDFNSGTPVPVYDGQLSSQEGVATICNSNGNLLFYTDGVTVWNRLHQVMPNGTGLLGHFSSTQSAVVVPKIGETTKYYVFTMDVVNGVNGLQYSIVNMSLDNGNGDIETKNVPVISNVTEKLTAVRHCNKRDIWVIVHKDASYYAFLLDPSGVNTTPVISNTGSVVVGGTAGYLKASPDGKKIAAAHHNTNADISDFDNATGVVSNTYNLFQSTDSTYRSYGIEFSPNSKNVYATAVYMNRAGTQWGEMLLQFDVSLSSPAAVRASKQVLAQNPKSVSMGALQVAPDGKIYLAKVVSYEIGAINHPNVYGLGCGFVSSAVKFTQQHHYSTLGFPSFIQSYFYQPDSFTYNVVCPGSTIAFHYPASARTTSVLWNFGDTASGADNVSTLHNPTHRFRAPGLYNVRLINFTNCGPDTVWKTIQTDTLGLALGPDTLVCGDTSVLINPVTAGGFNKYVWQDSSTNFTYLAKTSGLYWVEITNQVGCSKRDSIQVSFQSLPIFSLGNDTTICENDRLMLNADAAKASSYRWNTGAVTSSVQPYKAGVYWCEANGSGCVFRDSLVLNVKSSPVVNLGSDITVCEGTTISLDATYLNSGYLWQDGSTNPTYTATQPGTYFVQVNYNGCQNSDTIKVNHNLKPRFTLGPDQMLCPGNTIMLKPSLNPSWQLLWQDGSRASNFVVTQPGTYKLSATNQCGSTTDEMVISGGICKVYVPNGFTPNHDGKNDLFKVLGVENVTSFHLKIFNRWGEVVFETTDKTKGWDGMVKGASSLSGVFVYVLKYTDTNLPGSQSLKGSFVLIR